MKTLNITFTDREFLELKRIKDNRKGKLNWHLFVLRAARKFKVLKGGLENGKNNNK